MTPPQITLLEGKVWLVTSPTGFGQYDFNFDSLFACDHPFRLDEEITAVARMGATQDYPTRYEQLLEMGIKLIHSPDDYLRTSVLPTWYPLIEEFTPKSLWFEKPPPISEIEASFNWPIFVKGERQTSKHDGSLAIIRSAAHYQNLIQQWESDPILWWQRIVCREFVELQPATDEIEQGSMPKSYEFRTFWWKGTCVGIGRYWVAVNYKISESDRSEITKIGEEVARRIESPFLVIDFAKSHAGDWIVIECNDGQDSGYAGVNPGLMWRNIVELECERSVDASTPSAI